MSQHLPKDVRLEIEYGIARGWSEPRIAAEVGASMQAVRAVRRALDQLAVTDAFEVGAKFDQPRDRCFRDHLLTEDNVYRPPARPYKRECATCRRDRMIQRKKKAA